MVLPLRGKDAGKSIKLDSRDVPTVFGYRVHLSTQGYPSIRVMDEHGQHKTIPVHRLLFKDELSSGLVVDHVNGNKLDCRRANLRVCTITQNSWNRGTSRNSTTGQRGIYRMPNRKLWRVMLGHQNKRLLVGYFRDFDDAIKARDEAATKLYGVYFRP